MVALAAAADDDDGEDDEDEGNAERFVMRWKLRKVDAPADDDAAKDEVGDAEDPR